MISVIIPVVRPNLVPNLISVIKANAGVEHEIVTLEDVNGIGAPKMIKELVSMTKYDKVCFLGDDTLPGPNFLYNALSCMNSTDAWIVGINDQISIKPTHWLADKKILPYIGGEFFHTGYHHNYCDDELAHKAKMLGRYAWCESAKLKHCHPAFGTARSDKFYEKANSGISDDEKLFVKRNCKISVVIRGESKYINECVESVASEVDQIVIMNALLNRDDYGRLIGDWVLYLESDEVMEEGWGRMKLYFSSPYDAIGIAINSLVSPRVFRNVPQFDWRNFAINGCCYVGVYNIFDIHAYKL